MQKQNSLLRGVVSLWLAVALLFAPLAAPFAAILSADNAAHTVHENASVVVDTADMHADHVKTQTATDAAGQKGASCDRHDHHGGKCCATCVQCLTAAPAMPAMFIPTHSPRLSAVPRLHDRLVVAAHDRPPAV
jgi:hypothetical protein